MRVLIDTNVLLRYSNKADDRHTAAEQAVLRLVQAGHQAVLCPQVLVDFWGVATRPKSANGLGLHPNLAARDVTSLKSAFELVSDTPLAFAEWERLVSQYAICGKAVHDARLAAAMIASEIEGILTFNSADFRRFEEIVVLEP